MLRLVAVIMFAALAQAQSVFPPAAGGGGGAPSGAAGGSLQGTYPNPGIAAGVALTNPSMGSGASAISRTVTAGTGGVTAKHIAAKDTSDPTRRVLPASGGCGAGIAATTATVGNTFEMYTGAGMVITGVADNAVTAGHILVGGTTTPGRVKDSGQTSRAAVDPVLCVMGVALQGVSAGADVQFEYDGPGTYGSNISWTRSGTTTSTTDTVSVGTSLLVNGCAVYSGSGSPNSAVTGSVCDVYRRTDGGSGTVLYVKESGSATNTGWVAYGAATMVYPGAGIANSTGSAWGTSYTTTGSGTVIALSASPVFTGVVTVPQGSKTAPSYTFATNTNDGIYNQVAGYVAVTAAGKAVARFHGTGTEIGGGTSGNPVTLWLVKGDVASDSPDIALFSGSAGLLEVNNGTPGTTAANYRDLKLRFVQGGSAAPTLSSCGTSPSVSGSDLSGAVTEGSGASGCTITFVDAPLYCTMASQAGLGFTYSLSGAVLTVVNVGSLSSTILNYVCTK